MIPRQADFGRRLNAAQVDSQAALQQAGIIDTGESVTMIALWASDGGCHAGGATAQ